MHKTFHISVDIMHGCPQTRRPSKSLYILTFCAYVIRQHLQKCSSVVSKTFIRIFHSGFFRDFVIKSTYLLMTRSCCFKALRVGSSRVLSVSTVHNVHIAVNEDRAREIMFGQHWDIMLTINPTFVFILKIIRQQIWQDVVMKCIETCIKKISWENIDTVSARFISLPFTSVRLTMAIRCNSYCGFVFH